MNSLRILYAGLLILAAGLSSSATADNTSDPMVALQPLIGTWQVVNARRTPDGWQEIARTRTTFRKILNGMMIQEVGAYSTGQVFNVRDYYSWDPFRKVYRTAFMDGTHGLMDIYEGSFDESGVFTIDNVRSGTFFPSENGGETAFRFRYHLVEGSPYILIDASSDGGKAWAEFFRVDFLPIDQVR